MKNFLLKKCNNTGVPKFAIGVSHMDRNLNYWSGNLKGFIQYRKLLEVQE